MPLPPLGSASSFPHTVHVTFEAGFPKMIWLFLHFEHDTLMNLLFGSLIRSFILLVFSDFCL